MSGDLCLPRTGSFHFSSGDLRSSSTPYLARWAGVVSQIKPLILLPPHWGFLATQISTPFSMFMLSFGRFYPSPTGIQASTGRGSDNTSQNPYLAEHILSAAVSLRRWRWVVDCGDSIRGRENCGSWFGYGSPIPELIDLPIRKALL